MTAFLRAHRVRAISLDDQVGILYTTSDPLVGVGVAAPIGSLLIWKFNPPQLFQKIGNGNNDWEIIGQVNNNSSYRIEQTIFARNSIPNEERTEGLLCYVVEDGNEYRLIGGINNTNWQILESDFVDAPSDGKTYGRRNNNWIEITVASGTGPAGNNMDVQYRDGAIFGGSSQFQYNTAENKLTVAGTFIKKVNDKTGVWVL